MEKTMSVEERIRRAEEIYNKRRGQSKEENIARVNVNEKKDLKLFRKLILQIITCLFIYCIFYLIVNNNYIFSQDFKNKAKEILSYDINFQNLYHMGVEKFNSIFEEKKTEDKQENQPNQDEDNVQDSTENTNNNEDTSSSNQDIGGASETTEISEVQDTPNENLSQEEQDIKYIKETINFIKPVEGRISSKFGYRETSVETIPKNHTGLDIAANTGTKIVSATDGTVILASSKGDYRKPLTNTNK